MSGGVHYGWVVVCGACVCNFLHVGLNRSMGIFYDVFLEKFQDTAAATATFLAIANTLRMVLGRCKLRCKQVHAKEQNLHRSMHSCRVVVICIWRIMVQLLKLYLQHYLYHCATVHYNSKLLH